MVEVAYFHTKEEVMGARQTPQEEKSDSQRYMDKEGSPYGVRIKKRLSLTSQS